MENTDVLLFWGTVEGFLSGTEEFHLHSKKGCQTPYP